MAIDLVDIGLSPGDENGDPGRVAFDKVNKMFTELYSIKAQVKFTEITTATYIITANELQVGYNIFGVNYVGIVLITLPAGIQSDRLIIINDESGQAGTNNILLNVA